MSLLGAATCNTYRRPTITDADTDGFGLLVSALLEGPPLTSGRTTINGASIVQRNPALTSKITGFLADT